MQFKEENGRKRKREGTENRNTNEKEGEGGEHNTICTFKRKRGQKSSQGLSISRQVTIKHSLQSLMYTWH